MISLVIVTLRDDSSIVSDGIYLRKVIDYGIIGYECGASHDTSICTLTFNIGTYINSANSRKLRSENKSTDSS